ncbi:hypothetical protein G6035_04540 [Arthrobacter sp. SDTb3-6]|nr:hypothetical protein [Arthrobacter sp. SDTb3-6]NVM97927.1 hypothetical protein [Arthrobacter sp. SDTb3-6]
MWWGWRGRLRRQAGIAGLPAVPDDAGPAALSVAGQYVTTTSAGDWLDRIAAHGMGIRTNATLELRTTGVLLLRKGAADVYIAADAMTEVSTQAGMAGKFVEKDGLVVITWRLGEKLVDTGFRTTDAAAKKPLVTALRALVPAQPDPPATELPDADHGRKNDENE